MGKAGYVQRRGGRYHHPRERAHSPAGSRGSKRQMAKFASTARAVADSRGGSESEVREASITGEDSMVTMLRTAQLSNRITTRYTAPNGRLAPQLGIRINSPMDLAGSRRTFIY
eukprot:4263693-Pleurochrysis_carterae.AAC.5